VTALRIAILGGGPIGLDAALAAAAAGHDARVYEIEPTVGGAVRRWGHVRMFTPWSMNVSPRMAAALGDAAPDGDEVPTGAQLADRLLAPVAATPALAGRIRTGVRVRAVARQGRLKHEGLGSPDRAAERFRLLLQDVATGEESVAHADVVVDATGTYGQPNRLGDGGIDAVGEQALEDRIVRHLPDLTADPARWAGRSVLLTGAGHSAQTAARALAVFARDAPGTHVTWAIRDADPDFGAVAGDPLPERASLNATAAALRAGSSDAIAVRTGVVTEALRADADGRVAVTLRNGGPQDIVVDEIIALNGGHPDGTLYRQLQVQECYATLGPIRLAAVLLGETSADCLAPSTAGSDALRTAEPGFFILGAKSYGTTSTFLLRVGWQQVDDVFGALLPG
jgi:thioredoxin reductase